MSDQQTMTKLYAAIVKHSGMERPEIIEAGRHGAGAGWPGFTYTHDTDEFMTEYGDLVWQFLQEEAEDLGAALVTMISGIRGAEEVESKHGFDNMLACYTLEAVGQWAEITEALEEGGVSS